MTRSILTQGWRRDRSRGQAMVEFALVAPMLFILILGIIEMGRFIFYYELLNNATREGARFAIVSGAKSACPQGPMPLGAANPCDPDEDGDGIKTAVEAAAISLVSQGDLFVSDPIWTDRFDSTPPQRGVSGSGDNGRGDRVTVFVDYSYDPLIRAVVDVPILPTITISAESTLVINN